MLRVLWPWKPAARVRSTSERTAAGVATPIVSARTTSARPREARGELRHDARIDASLERATERARDRHRRRRLARRREDRLDALDRLGERRVPVAEVEGLGDRKGHVDAIEAGSGEALPAAFVEDEARELDALAPLHAVDDLLGARHLRHAVGADEAHRLDAAQPGRREPVDELRPRLGRQHLGLVLEAVARSDVADDDVHHGRA